MSMPEQLQIFGDDNSFFSQNKKNKRKPEWLKGRGGLKETCMISCNFNCVICKALFDSFQELKIHIVEHQAYNCLGCNLVFGSYEELLAQKNDIL